MKVVLLKDVQSIGLAGQVKNVKDGFAINFLFPQKLAKKASEVDAISFTKKVQKAVVDVQVAGSRVAALAETLQKTNLIIKKKIHNENKLYGAIHEDEIVEALAAKNIQVNKKQIEIPKAIRTIGEHSVFIRLTSKLKPELKVKIEAE